MEKTKIKSLSPGPYPTRSQISKTPIKNKKPETEIASEGKKVLAKAGTVKETFYTKVLDEAEQLDFETAAGIDGIDDEITLLRIKIKSILKEEPDNIRLLMAATSMLTRLVKARYSMNQKQEKSLGESIKNIIRDIGVPLGVAVINKKL